VANSFRGEQLQFDPEAGITRLPLNLRSHDMRRLLIITSLLLAACGAEKPAQKQGPFDFDTRSTPTPAEFNSEANVLRQWNDVGTDSLRDFWNAGEAGSFKGVDGIDIVYRIHRAQNPKAAVVLVPGRTEAIIKFAEVARDLVKQGYSTYAVTLRGQGEAGRMLTDKEKGYVAWFEDYITDTHHFITDVVNKDNLPVFMIAHSLGGAVAVLLVNEHPDDVKALVMTSPMLEIDVGSFPPPVVSTLAGGVCDSTDGSGYAVGAGPYTKETDFPTNTVTNSEPRWTWKIQQLTDDASIRLGGITWRWLCQGLVASSRAQGLGSAVPTVLFQAGADTIVKPGGQLKYCTNALRCTLSKMDGAKHELLQEKDDIRNLVLSRTVKFFDAQVTP
jgi:lysophospholipase